MAKTLLEGPISDTSTHTAVQQINDYDGNVLFHLVNDLNADVTVEFVGTRQGDDDFTDGASLGSQTVAADDVEYETLTDSWDQIQVRVTADTTPSEGEASVYFMS